MDQGITFLAGVVTTILTTYITTRINSKEQLKQIEINFKNEITREKIKLEEKRKDEHLNRKREALEKLTEILLKIYNENTLTKNYMLEKEGEITQEKATLFIQYHKNIDELEQVGLLKIIMYMPNLQNSFKEMKSYRSCAWGNQKNFFIEKDCNQGDQERLTKYIENINKVKSLCENMLYQVQCEAEQL